MVSIAFTRGKSVLSTKPECVNARFALVDFLVRMWLLKACFLFTFPVPVTVNLFLALEFVFILGILLFLFIVLVVF
jgi:hypothetical protein